MIDITMLELRQNSQAIIRALKNGKEMTLTYRGQAVAKLMPVKKKRAKNTQKDNFSNDPVYRLWEHAEAGSDSYKPLTNEEIDRLVYGI